MSELISLEPPDLPLHQLIFNNDFIGWLLLHRQLVKLLYNSLILSFFLFLSLLFFVGLLVREERIKLLEHVFFGCVDLRDLLLLFDVRSAYWGKIDIRNVFCGGHLLFGLLIGLGTFIALKFRYQG